MTKMQTPDYIFESSWEVCNKVGGIYTVLSTRAKTLQDNFQDRIIFVGPDFWQNKENPLFIEDTALFADWKEKAATEGLLIRTGRWNIPGKPLVLLVDFQPFFAQKNQIYTGMWNDFQIDSLHAYGDYDEASMFSYASARTVESFYRFYLNEDTAVIYQAHEWMTGMGALYLQKAVPAIATIFTTHATSIGRSIAGNGKPLYDYLFAYNGDQMAGELNIQSKHSVEKQTAHFVDCFTTVSDITARECAELLDKQPDVVLMNGFENDFVPVGSTYNAKRKRARALKLRVANCLLGEHFTDEDTLIIGTSGRYEFKNKGINVFLEALNRLNRDKGLKKRVLAFINVPGWVGDPREDLMARISSREIFTTPLSCPMITHWLHNMTQDQVLDMLKYMGMNNSPQDMVKVIFVPCYLNGVDGIINKHYYDVLPCEDITVYPSYYEPWGYTPLESVAFKVPTVTTDLAGFGLWVNSLKADGQFSQLEDGVKVIHRSDYNYSEVADAIRDTIVAFSQKSEGEVKRIRRSAAAVAEKALWKHFIKYYYEAYDMALRNARKRVGKSEEK